MSPIPPARFQPFCSYLNMRHFRQGLFFLDLNPFIFYLSFFSNKHTHGHGTQNL